MRKECHKVFWFDLPFRKEEGKFKQETKNVRQGLSKVFVFFTYSSKPIFIIVKKQFVIYFLFLVEMTSCGGTSSDNNTYLVQSSSTSITSPCMYKVCPVNANICRIRYDFTVGSFFFIQKPGHMFTFLTWLHVLSLWHASWCFQHAPMLARQIHNTWTGH